MRGIAAILGWLIAAAPALAQGARLAVGPDDGGYLCPDGRQLYVDGCFDNSPYANCAVINMHLPLNRMRWQVETTETRENLIAQVAACKVYPVEFRDGIVSLVLPKSVTTQQTANAPAVTPTPKASANPASTNPATAPTRPATNPSHQVRGPARQWGRVEYLGEYIYRIGNMKVEYLGEYIHRIGDMKVEYLGEYIHRIGDMKVEYLGEYIHRIGDMKVEYLGEYIYRIGN